MPTEQLDDMRARLGDKVHVGPYLGTYYYAVKLDKEPWSNLELRRAISMAIDRDFLAEEVWSNSMIPAYGMVPPGIEGYEVLPGRLCRTWTRSSAKTQPPKILARLGYGPDNPLKLEIRFNTSENHQKTAVAIQEQLRPLGIEVTLLNTDMVTHYGHLEQKGDFDYARAGWIADYKDPESFLGISRAASGNNYSSFNNPDFERRWTKPRPPAAIPRSASSCWPRRRRSSSTISPTCRCSITASTRWFRTSSAASRTT